MKHFRVDLHIHSLLSPCGDLDMCPRTIVNESLARGLDAIAVADHNATMQIAAVQRLAARCGLAVIPAVEITTREEAHMVAFFPTVEVAASFQNYLDSHIVRVENVPEKFGDQVWVDEHNNICGEVEWYLNSALDRSVDDIAARVKSLSGLVVAAHVDRASYSLIGQLGFISPALSLDALEYNSIPRMENILRSNGYLNRYTHYTASDAHFPHLIGTNPSWLNAEEPTFDELSQAFAARNGRSIVSCGKDM